MVSIPDWARFARILGNKSPATPHSKYYKQREEEVVRQAEEHGYFLKPSKSFLEENFAPEEPESRQSEFRISLGDTKKSRDINQIFLVNLASSHIRDLGDIVLCKYLTVCILSNNYLSKFDMLAECPNLMKLDLHSNQITMLPNNRFWLNLEFLRILLLHDNPIGKIENLQHLSGCPKLTALTLNDTPLSLKRNYRHHVVNSIWSLKALDNYVISDEEIIEDADFGGSFTPCHPSFYINLCPEVSPDSTFEEEIAVVMKIMSDINLILAHKSPVIIIQKFIRGFLVRKKYKFTQDMKICFKVNPDVVEIPTESGESDSSLVNKNLTTEILDECIPDKSCTDENGVDENVARQHSETVGDKERGASVTVQRKYRDYKGWKSGLETPPPTMSPSYEMSATPPSTIDSMKIDYDTYMMHRRPGSTAGISEASSRLTGAQFTGEDILLSPDGRGRPSIYINMSKLEMGTLASLQDEALTMDTAFLGDRMYTDEWTSKRSSRRSRRRRQPEVKKKVMKTVKQFFGPIVQNVASPEPLAEALDSEEVPVVNFRLRGIKQHIRVVDPTEELILARQDAGHEVRLAEANYHRKLASLPPIARDHRHDLSPEKRLFSKIQGNMGLSCLRAVQQAYRDREVAEKQTARLETVLRLKEERELAKERIRLFQEERRAATLKARTRDQKLIVDQLDRKQYMHMNNVEKNQERRSMSSQWSKSRKGERSFMSDFNIQNTSVSNALMRHDRQAQIEDKKQGKFLMVKSRKQVEDEQKMVVQRYMEHRRLMRQSESANQRTNLGTKMLQEANDRLLTARQRVAQQKARTANVSACSTPAARSRPHSLPQVKYNTTTQVM